MPAGSIEEDEQIIQNLEELDSTFSSIKSNLREMKVKVSRIALVNRKIAEDLGPWTRFFESEKKVETSPFSELQLHSLRFREVMDSPDVMNANAPKNPFIETNSSDLLNKSILKEYKGCIASESSNTIMLNKSRFENYDTVVANDSEETEATLQPFSLSQIPEIFHQERDLKDLYDMIAHQKTVSVEDLCSKFEAISPEKLEIFINLLCRKNFIRQKNNYLTIEK